MYKDILKSNVFFFFGSRVGIQFYKQYLETTAFSLSLR